MASIATASTRQFQIAETPIFIELSGQDLEMTEKIEKIAKKFTSCLGLEDTNLMITSTISGTFFSSSFSTINIPASIFSEETRINIDRPILARFKLDTDEETLTSLIKAANSMRELFSSLSLNELEYIIGHEIGHYWLEKNFAAFTSTCMKFCENFVTETKHDRKLEKICDFIGAKLSSPEAGMTSMMKSSKITPDPSEIDSHPKYSERITYLASWISDPRLNQILSKELAADIGGDVFREAVPIYMKHGIHRD